MAVVPINNSTLSAQTGPVGPRASPISFGDFSGAQDIGAATRQAGMQVTATASRINRDRSASWANKSLAQLSRSYSDFLNNEENQKKETLDRDFKKFSDEQLRIYSKNAPNKDALDMFTTRAFDATTGYIGAAVTKASRTRAVANIQSVEQQINDVTVEAHNLYRTIENPGIASGMVSQRIDAIEQGIDTVFEGMPETQRTLKRELFRSAALSAIDSHPEFSKKLAESRWIDEPTRMAILKQMESNQETLDVGLKVSYTQGLDSEITSAIRSGNAIPQRNQEEFKAVYGKNWESNWLDFEEKRNGVNIQNQFLESVRGMNPSAQKAAFQKLLDKAEANPRDGSLQLAVNGAEQRIAQWQAAMRADPVGSMQRDHPRISKAYQMSIDQSLTEDKRAAYRSAYLDLLEYYQRPAPLGADGKPTSPPELHHPVQHDQVTLMSESVAEQWAEVFKGSDTNDWLTKATEFENEFAVIGDPAKSAGRTSDAFEDVVRLGKLEGEFELAFMNRTDARVSRYLDSLKNKAGNLKLWSADKTAELFRQEIVADSQVSNFIAAASNGGQRNARIGEYVDGIHAYATHLVVNQGMTTDKARKEAVSFLLGTSQKVVESPNDRHLSIARERKDPNAPIRDDEEMDKIMMAQRDLFSEFRSMWNKPDHNPGIAKLLPQINRKDQYGVPLFPTIEQGTIEADKLALLARKIGIDGYLVRTRDGQGATLWVKGDNATDFELTDKNGRPIQINWDDRMDPEFPPVVPYDMQLQNPITQNEMLRLYPYRVAIFDFPNQGIKASETRRAMRDRALGLDLRLRGFPPDAKIDVGFPILDQK